MTQAAAPVPVTQRVELGCANEAMQAALERFDTAHEARRTVCMIEKIHAA